MTQKHTPGPWEQNGETINSRFGERGALNTLPVIHVCESHKTNENWHADANLIAAAPDMLAALEALQRRFVEVSENYSKLNSGGDGKCWSYGATENNLALAAIAKARGQS